MYAEQKGIKHEKEVLPLFGTLLLLSICMKLSILYKVFAYVLFRE